MNEITIGASAARGDIFRGSVMTEDEARAYARRLWPPGEAPERTGTLDEGHGTMIPGGFFVWRVLRDDFVRDYMRTIRETGLERC